LPRWRERTAEELQRIASLARSAVGFDERRGDRVEVVSLRFAEPPAADGAPEGFVILGHTVPTALMGRVVESAMLALVALAAILLVGRPVAGRLAIALAPPPPLTAATVAGALPGRDAAAALAGDNAGGGTDAASLPSPALPAGTSAPIQPGEQMVNVARVTGQIRASALHAIAEIVEKNPDESAAVLRRWLFPEETAT
jgi:flagellar M-ring protein FliF